MDTTLLSPEDLQAFLMRRNAIEQARLHYAMLAAGYESWAIDLRGRYKIEGPFEVDSKTGEIREVTLRDEAGAEND